MQIIEQYDTWSQAYQEDQITIAYDTMWEGTMQLAHTIGAEIARLAPETRVKIFNISKADKNDIMAEVFKSKAIAVGCPTALQSILSSMGGWLEFLNELKFKNKKAAVFGCYGWSGEGNKILRERLTSAGFAVVEPEVKCNWRPTDGDLSQATEVARALCE
jgi:flavorubredoxin